MWMSIILGIGRDHPPFSVTQTYMSAVLHPKPLMELNWETGSHQTVNVSNTRPRNQTLLLSIGIGIGAFYVCGGMELQQKVVCSAAMYLIPVTS